MRANLQLLLGIGIFFLIFSHTSEAQILQTRSDIIKDYGTPFSSGISKKGENYLYYKIPVTTKNSGTYNQGRIFFFKNMDGGDETCYKWKILEPSTETLYNIESFDRDLVRIGEFEWKDHAKSIVYKIEETKNLCKISVTYTNEPELAKVFKF